MRNVLILFSCMLLIGCAAGNKYNYRAEVASLPLKTMTEKTLLLALDDRRPYVLSGKKNPDFVGLQRGGFGNPFDVTTASGKLMIDDMATSIAASLEQSGYTVEIAEGGTEMTKLIVLAKNSDAYRIIQLQVFEWKSDIYRASACIMTCDFPCMTPMATCWQKISCEAMRRLAVEKFQPLRTLNTWPTNSVSE